MPGLVGIRKELSSEPGLAGIRKELGRCPAWRVYVRSSARWESIHRVQLRGLRAEAIMAQLRLEGAREQLRGMDQGPS